MNMDREKYSANFVIFTFITGFLFALICIAFVYHATLP